MYSYLSHSPFAQEAKELNNNRQDITKNKMSVSSHETTQTIQYGTLLLQPHFLIMSHLCSWLKAAKIDDICGAGFVQRMLPKTDATSSQ
jgi:hypothetical protein